ncbi:hypothetical protein OZX57_04175 [Bifidobacterium sp. ESL0682]|uniref:hypothetical protein n=1 Tax=Bifidobacterium sp. ESL0682 TaxID=2983212 RepID=UPI0023F80793|nr:hypothetical protein [Bifidobacterium sp. ESL0682]WEV42613.1 hypothetical protein OZX57_04175 [Bifidobacterium sp. ESL0682]
MMNIKNLTSFDETDNKPTENAGNDAKMTKTDTLRTSKFGNRTVFGGGKAALWGTSLVIGCVLGLIVGVAVFLLNTNLGKDRLVAGIISGVGIAILASMFVLDALADKRTIKGASPEVASEENIEHSWFESAKSWGFDAMIISDFVVLFVLKFAANPIDVKIAYLAVAVSLIVGFLISAGRYAYLAFKNA